MDCQSLPPNYKEAVRVVLERIMQANPEDHQLLLDFVESVELHDFGDGGQTGGERVVTRYPASIEDYRADDRVADGILWGKILLRPGLSERELLQIFVHECGHAATTDDDLQEVGGPCDEWRSELAADRKAIQWGFRDETLERRQSGDWIHHALGDWIEDFGRRWRITEDLRVEPMENPDE